MSLVVDESAFTELLRVCNTNIPGKLKVPYALAKIKGIGKRYAMMICQKAGIDMSRKAGTLSKEELKKIDEVMAEPEKFKIPLWYYNRRFDRATGKDLHVISNHLVSSLRTDLERLKRIQCERGFRHERGLKLRGQHTKTTGRRGKTLGVSKKKAKMDFKEIKRRFEKFEQSHVLKFFPEISKNEQNDFLKYLDGVNLEYLQKIFQISTNQKVKKMKISPPLKSSIQTIPDNENENYFKKGLDLIKKNSVGLILLAGGQGTRLGYDKPKGMYPHLGLPSKSTLFQMQAAKIKRLETLSNGTLQWYIMTSSATHEDIVQYFENEKYMGLKKEQVHFFMQGHLPCLTEKGKLILKTKSELATAPNGNGAMYQALKQTKMIDDMKKRGVKHVHMYCVDNILAKVGDPVFIAKCAERETEFGSKVIAKRAPHEKVGVFAIKDGKYHVVEYSEITKEMAEAKKEGSEELLYNESNIVNFYFSFSFLEKCCNLEFEVYHVARKEIPTIDDKGNATKVKGIKLELFNFDICHLAKKVSLVMGKREEDFSPLKNKPGSGNNCPETCVRDFSKYNIKLIEKAGGLIERKSKEEEEVCEISPIISYYGEGLEKIVKGKKFTFPVLLDIDKS